MFARVASFALLALPLLASATPAVIRRDDCNTGSMQCCNSVHDTNESAVSVLLGLVGLDASSLTGQVGLQCSGISAVGAGSGSSCSASPVCCTNNNVGGLISVGCIPIML